MIEVRFHGRGGQGAVTSAEMLALAAIEEGRFAQAMPSFGPERRGAPVAAFARVDEERIRLRIGITNPGIVIVLDPSLIELPAVQQGLEPGGIVIANHPGKEAEVREEMGGYSGRLAIVDATALAYRILGVPITNTSMLGAFAMATGEVRVDSFMDPLRERFGKIAEKNIDALKAAYDETRLSEKK